MPGCNAAADQPSGFPKEFVAMKRLRQQALQRQRHKHCATEQAEAAAEAAAAAAAPVVKAGYTDIEGTDVIDGATAGSSSTQADCSQADVEGVAGSADVVVDMGPPRA